MPKKKYKLSQKHERLIDIETEIPKLQDLRNMAVSRDWTIVDHRWNAEDSLMMALKTISSGTQYEDVCKNIVSRCEVIFQHYDDK